MLKKKKANSQYDEDNILLMKCMDKIIEGNFCTLDENAFHNKEFALKFNTMLISFLKSNNHFVMRLNQSMSKIGDSTCVKEMIEQVNSQTSAINDMKESSQDLGNSIQNIQYAVQNIQQNTHDVIQTADSCINEMNTSIRSIDDSSQRVLEINDQVALFQEKAIKINEIIDIVKKIAKKSGLLALNASIEAARAGEAGRGFAVVANQIKDLSANTTASAEDVVRYVDELLTGITSLADSISFTTNQLQDGNENVHHSLHNIDVMNDNLTRISNEIDGIYEEINKQSALTQSFVSSIDSIANSYDILSQECVGTGAHLYQISRDVDKARSDMARKNSKLTTLDWLNVFEVDHLIFTWRVYNNLADFERLEITQLNNPSKCKLGKWISSQTDKRIISLDIFQQVLKDHENIHKYACESWYAKDKGDREEALRLFNLAYHAYHDFTKSINGLKEEIKKAGDTEITDLT